MKMLVAILPTIVLMVYAQLVIKWRVQALLATAGDAADGVSRLKIYLSDPLIITSYVAALAGSAAWMFVMERYSVSLAFPIYIGLTIVLVAIGGAALFHEPVTTAQVVSIALILAGVAIGSRG